MERVRGRSKFDAWMHGSWYPGEVKVMEEGLVGERYSVITGEIIIVELFYEFIIFLIP